MSHPHPITLLSSHYIFHLRVQGYVDEYINLCVLLMERRARALSIVCCISHESALSGDTVTIDSAGDLDKAHAFDIFSSAGIGFTKVLKSIHGTGPFDAVVTTVAEARAVMELEALTANVNVPLVSTPQKKEIKHQAYNYYLYVSRESPFCHDDNNFEALTRKIESIFRGTQMRYRVEYRGVNISKGYVKFELNLSPPHATNADIFREDILKMLSNSLTIVRIATVEEVKKEKVEEGEEEHRDYYYILHLDLPAGTEMLKVNIQNLIHRIQDAVVNRTGFNTRVAYLGQEDNYGHLKFELSVYPHFSTTPCYDRILDELTKIGLVIKLTPVNEDGSPKDS